MLFLQSLQSGLDLIEPLGIIAADGGHAGTEKTDSGSDTLSLKPVPCRIVDGGRDAGVPPLDLGHRTIKGLVR